MSSELGVAVFARTPGSGGKTRLAACWSRELTDTFYEHCLRCAGHWLEAAHRLATCYWALTGPGSRTDQLWQTGLILEQGEGGLGQRMAEISERLSERHRYWCLIGTDIPQMPGLEELQLVRRLEKTDFLFAPAVDGGFWLAAGRRVLPRHVWTEVRYSRSDTLSSLHKTLSARLVGCSVDIISPQLNDIDTLTDIKQLVHELAMNEGKLSPPQADLLHWLRRVPGLVH